MRSPRRIPSFRTVLKTTPKKYGEPPGYMRIVRRNLIMDKPEHESIMPNPYEIAHGVQWQGFAGTYRTNKNHTVEGEKPFFITCEMGPLAN
jgi:hypothetical protein